MRLLPTLLAALVLCFAACSPRIYKPTDFDQRTANHKTVAIIPAQVLINLRPNQMARTSTRELARNEEATGYAVQEQMYGWFLRRSNHYRFAVSFQDITQTNALINKAGADYEELSKMSRSELAQLLGVDAVITTSVRTDKPMSEGVAVALGVLTQNWGTTNQAFTSISIHEASRGDLVWKYDYQAAGSLGSSPAQLVNALMRNASRRFPYIR